jgi:hypothetical protein
MRRQASSSDFAVTSPSLCILAVEGYDVPDDWVASAPRVLDRDETLVPRDFLDESLHEGRLAGTCLAADDDGLMLSDGETQELRVASSLP